MNNRDENRSESENFAENIREQRKEERKQELDVPDDSFIAERVDDVDSVTSVVLRKLVAKMQETGNGYVTEAELEAIFYQSLRGQFELVPSDFDSFREDLLMRAVLYEPLDGLYRPI